MCLDFFSGRRLTENCILNRSYFILNLQVLLAVNEYKIVSTSGTRSHIVTTFEFGIHEKQVTIHVHVQYFASPRKIYINPLVTNGLSHYHLDESTFILRGYMIVFSFFSMKIISVNRIAPDETPRFSASHLRLFCLPMSHKQDARLIFVKLRVWVGYND